ncbi:class I SAM-dependent methyltransferase [Pseudoalteromonas sp. T1lg75]|uniref:class I SAM-dependent methyltransferase n=1 Tax=Pseudoalteromonas sp. T1lg75 TaxID=2077102 RepID=UPI000CF66623|nr:class I SAM-dependent methyltransferase [Pseudoalteromonas sp. T1lg75]
MTTTEKSRYYDLTEHSAVRDDLRFAVTCVAKHGVVIDCGCGAGADIAYLRAQGFTVHAFDIESEAMARCQTRFSHDPHVHLSQASFSSFAYPQADLIVADASLFFCPVAEFDRVWERLTGALLPDGLFCGSFVGPEDTMASEHYSRDAYWPEVLVLDETQIKHKLLGFDILRWQEHRVSGETANGEPHHWHIFSVVARKSN